MFSVLSLNNFLVLVEGRCRVMRSGGVVGWLVLGVVRGLGVVVGGVRYF